MVSFLFAAFADLLGLDRLGERAVKLLLLAVRLCDHQIKLASLA